MKSDENDNINNLNPCSKIKETKEIRDKFNKIIDIKLLKETANLICKEFTDFYRDNLNMQSLEFDEFIKYNTKDFPITFRLNSMK